MDVRVETLMSDHFTNTQYGQKQYCNSSYKKSSEFAKETIMFLMLRNHRGVHSFALNKQHERNRRASRNCTNFWRLPSTQNTMHSRWYRIRIGSSDFCIKLCILIIVLISCSELFNRRKALCLKDKIVRKIAW